MSQCGEIFTQTCQDGARQRRGETRSFRHAQEFNWTNLPAKRVQPAKVPHPRDQTSGRKIVTANISEPDVPACDGVVQFSGDVEPRERLEPQGVGEEANAGGSRSPRL